MGCSRKWQRFYINRSRPLKTDDIVTYHLWCCEHFVMKKTKNKQKPQKHTNVKRTEIYEPNSFLFSVKAFNKKYYSNKQNMKDKLIDSVNSRQI